MCWTSGYSFRQLSNNSPHNTSKSQPKPRISLARALMTQVLRLMRTQWQMNVIKSGSCGYTQLISIIIKEAHFHLVRFHSLLCTWTQVLLAPWLQNISMVDRDKWWVITTGCLANEECLHPQQTHKPICKWRDRALWQASQAWRLCFGCFSVGR